MSSCSISPYGYGTPPRRMTSSTLRGGGPSSRENSAAGKHCHSKAEFDAECAVRLRAHGVQSLELSARAQAARQRLPDAARRLSCLAPGTAETEHGGS